MITKQDCIKEIGTELFMREKVWKMSDAKNKRFLQASQQLRYETLRYIHAMLDVLQDSEFDKLAARIAKRVEEVQAQQDLFTSK